MPKTDKVLTPEQLAYDSRATAAVVRLRELLRQKIKAQKGLRQRILERLGWGSSYFTQTLNGSIELRVDVLHQLIEAAEFEPAAIFAELFRWQDPNDDGAGAAAEAAAGPASRHPPSEIAQLRLMLDGVVQMLVDSKLVAVTDLAAAVAKLAANSPIALPSEAPSSVKAV